MNKNNYILWVFLLSFLKGFSQRTVDSSLFNPNLAGVYPKKIVSALENINVSGYYRFLGYYSDMSLQYAEMGAIKRSVFIGDDSNIPQLLMNIAGKPSSTTSFSTDVFLYTPLTGSTLDYVKGLNLGVNLFGSHKMNFQTFFGQYLKPHSDTQILYQNALQKVHF